MNDLERLRILNTTRVLDALGSMYLGPELPCGQKFSAGCALLVLLQVRAVRALEPSARPGCGYGDHCLGPTFAREIAKRS